MAKRRRKKKTQPKHTPEDAGIGKTPKSFVIRSGKITASLSQLVKNIRKTLEPNTAARLKETRRNKMKDFVSVAGQFGVSHFVVVSKSDDRTNLRVARSPKGPTLCFRVEEFCLMRDVVASQSNARSPGLEYTQPPLLVLNNFNKDENRFKLMTSMFQNMFPTLNVQKMNVNDCRRVVLFHYDAETDRIHFRHYFISMKTAGVSKSVKRVVQTKMPNLSNYKDISEYVLKESGLSESEAEDNDESLIPATALGQSAKSSVQKRIKLIELGPRMTLNLTKIQDNLCGGEVLYHAFVSKTEEDLKKQKAEHDRKQKEKEQRKLEQEKNVEKKKLAAEEHKKRCAPDTGFEEEDQDEDEEDGKDIAEDAEDFDGSDFGEESDYSEVESEEDDDDKESEDEVYGTSEGEEELGDESDDD